MTVSTTTNKVSYSGNGSQTVFAYTFKIFADGDLTVIIRSSTGTETIKTLTTHYTVSGAGSSSGGNVTFTSGNTPASGDTVVIQRKLSLTQGTDYVANDPFPAESHEDALDRLTFITQQIQEEVDRSIKASVTNTISTTEFAVSATDRANKFFAFDSAGDLIVSQEIGTFRGNWAASTSYAQRDIVKDTSTNNIFIVNTAHTSTGAQPLTTNANSAKYDLLVDAATATSAQTAAAASETNAAASAAAALSHKNDAETAKTASETAKTASETAKTASELALTTFQDQYHGAAGSDPTTNLDAGDLYFNTSSGMKAYTGSAWEDVKPTSSEQTNINTLAAISSDVTSLANAIGASTTYAVTVAQSSGVNVFYLDGAAKPTLTLDRGNTYIFDQSDASNANHPLIFKDSSGNSYTTGVTVSGTAGQSGATVTIDVASNAPSALVYACSVHGNAMGNNITVVNSNLATVASNITSVNAVGTDIANVNSVGGSIANVNTVASNLTNVNAFADTYFVSATAPASPTTGDLWFDTSSNTMKVYGSSGFQNAGSSVNGTAQRSTFTATAGQTTFAATYDAGFVDVYLNGVKLIAGTDFTATNGTSVVLASGAAASDTVDIVAYGTFQLSNFSINDANDVNAAGASSGEFLKFDGTNFVPDSVPASNDASALTTGTLAAARLPTTGIDASSLSTGTLAAARLPTTGVDASSLSTGTLNHGRLPAGSVLQVVQATTGTNYASITSTSFVEVTTDLRCTITPKFANSQLLVMFHSMMYKTGGANPWGVATVYRDGSDIFGGTYQAGYTQVVGGASGDIHSGKKIVTANNTNATTFSLYVRAGSGYTMQMENTDRHIIVMEIAG